MGLPFYRISVRTIDEAERSETDPEDDSSSHILDVKDYEAIFLPNRSCKLIFFNIVDYDAFSS